MILNFVKIDPSGNSTVYVLDPLPREYYPKIAKKLLSPAGIGCEQVGFLEKSGDGSNAYRLYMAGGEFCGNAARGLAVWLAYRQYPCAHPDGKGGAVVELEVSGVEGALKIAVKDLDQAQHKYARIAMPLPLSITAYEVPGLGRFHAVDLGGIVHAVLEDQEPAMEKFCLVKQELTAKMGDLEAVGAMFYDQKTKELTPLVNVCGLDSLVWESSCGSGSISVGCVQAMKENKSVRDLRLKQPGGDLTVDIVWQDGVREAYLGGEITIVAEGTLFADIESQDS